MEKYQEALPRLDEVAVFCNSIQLRALPNEAQNQYRARLERLLAVCKRHYDDVYNIAMDVFPALEGIPILRSDTCQKLCISIRVIEAMLNPPQ